MASDGRGGAASVIDEAVRAGDLGFIYLYVERNAAHEEVVARKLKPAEIRRIYQQDY